MDGSRQFLYFYEWDLNILLNNFKSTCERVYARLERGYGATRIIGGLVWWPVYMRGAIECYLN